MAVRCLDCREHMPLGPSTGDDRPEIAWETVACSVALDIKDRRSFEVIEERLVELGVTDPIARWQFWEGMRQAADGQIAPAALAKILEKLKTMGHTVPGGEGAPDPKPGDGVVAYAAGDLAHRLYVDRLPKVVTVSEKEFAA